MLFNNIFITIAVILYALWIGGLSTTLYNRIPNDIPIGPNQKPRCNNCNAILKIQHFFPVFGFIFCRGKCYNCGMKIPRVYLILELSICFYILILSLCVNSIDERFISMSLYGAFLIVSTFIYYKYKQFKTSIVWILTFLILLYQGYCKILPNITDLFLCCFISYFTFVILCRKWNFDKNTLILLVILSTSIGYHFIIPYMVLFLMFNMIQYIPTLKNQINKYSISKDFIVLTILFSAIVISLLSL